MHVHPSHSLTLEWNNLGAWEDAFTTVCRALAGNVTLRQLDLRNNQISHQGAEELALALKSNTGLQQLGEARDSHLGQAACSLNPPATFILSQKLGAGVRRMGEPLWVPALLMIPQRKHPG